MAPTAKKAHYLLLPPPNPNSDVFRFKQMNFNIKTALTRGFGNKYIVYLNFEMPASKVVPHGETLVGKRPLPNARQTNSSPAGEPEQSLDCYI